VVLDAEAKQKADAQAAFRKEVDACVAKDALAAGNASRAQRASCGQVFDRLREGNKADPESLDQIAMGIVQAYHSRVDTGKHGGKADGAISEGDIKALRDDPRTPKHLLWAVKRVLKRDELSDQVVNYRPESCGAIGWAITNVTGGDCEFSWKKTGVELAAIAVVALACSAVPAGCGLALKAGMTMALTRVGEYSVEVAEGEHDWDTGELAVETTKAGATAYVGGKVLGMAARSPLAQKVSGRFSTLVSESPLAQKLLDKAALARAYTKDFLTRGGGTGAADAVPALRGTNASGEVTSRPGSFRQGTLQNAWDEAPVGQNGGRVCTSCGTEVQVPPNSGVPRDWDASHNPSWSNREFPADVTRPQVLDNYNTGVSLECPGCNRSGGNRRW
jgi:hypothetical protein